MTCIHHTPIDRECALCERHRVFVEARRTAMLQALDANAAKVLREYRERKQP